MAGRRSVEAINNLLTVLYFAQPVNKRAYLDQREWYALSDYDKLRLKFSDCEVRLRIICQCMIV